MVEGHQCHRVAASHRQTLLGKAFTAVSPNGRFKEGAAAINQKPLTRIEVHGKNLFYFFGSLPAKVVVVHIHFGMAGAFKTCSLPGPEPTDTTRLQLSSRWVRSARRDPCWMWEQRPMMRRRRGPCEILVLSLIM